MECPLCKREKLTTMIMEDDVCWVAFDASSRHDILIVLKRHSKEATEEEMEHMQRIIHELFPDKEFRGPKKILDHFHLHSI